MAKDNKIIVNIDTEYLIKECGIKPEWLLNKKEYFRKRFRTALYKKFNYIVFNESFMDTMDIEIEDDKVKCLSLSKTELLHKLQHILKTPNIYNDECKELEDEFQKRLATLKNIKTEKALMFQFPALSSIKDEGHSFYWANEAMKQYAYTNPKSLDLIGLHNSYQKYYEKCGLSEDIQTFLTSQYNGLQNMVNGRKSIEKFIDEKKTDITNFDEKKLNLVILYELICSNTDLQGNESLKSFVEKIINNDEYNEITIHDKDSNTITFEQIKELALKQLSKDQATLINIPWTTIPKGSKSSSKKITGIKTYSKNKKSYLKRLEESLKARDSKIALYENTPYIFKILGLDNFDGYVAYGYENGKIIADTIPSDKKITKAQNNAIYIFDAADFIPMSMKTKAQLKNEPSVTKLNHNGNWTKRINDTINEEATEEKKESALTLKRTIDALK